MNRAVLESLYRDLSETHRSKWSLEEFIALNNERVYHSAHFDMTEVDEEHALPKPQEREFGGIASAFNTRIDAFVPSIIKKGAFKNTLNDTEQQRRVKVLWQHSPFDPIGVPTMMRETNKGLQVMGKISDTPRGREVLTLMRDGVIDEMSIGFDPMEFHFVESEDHGLERVITEARLWEFSPVTFGANPGAKITAVNSLSQSLNTRELAGAIELLVDQLGKRQEDHGDCSCSDPLALAVRLTDEVQGLDNIEILSGLHGAVGEVLERLKAPQDSANPAAESGNPSEDLMAVLLDEFENAIIPEDGPVIIS